MYNLHLIWRGHTHTLHLHWAHAAQERLWWANCLLGARRISPTRTDIQIERPPKALDHHLSVYLSVCLSTQIPRYRPSGPRWDGRSRSNIHCMTLKENLWMQKGASCVPELAGVFDTDSKSHFVPLGHHAFFQTTQILSTYYLGISWGEKYSPLLTRHIGQTQKLQKYRESIVSNYFCSLQ